MAQKVFVVEDSSKLVFPNRVSIDFVRKDRRNFQTFEFTQAALKTLLVQCNYLYGIQEANLQRIHFLEKDASVKDSVVQVLRAQTALTGERLLVYSSGYDEMKAVSSAYDLQVKALIAELEAIRKSKLKDKRRTFSKGLLAGLAGGIAVTSVLIFRRN